MHFFRFSVSILHACASIFLFSLISLLKLTFPMQIRGRQPRRRKKPVSQKWGTGWKRL